MDFRKKLSTRLHLEDVAQVVSYVQSADNKCHKECLFELLFDTDKRVADNAAYVLSHFNRRDNKWLFGKHEALIDEALCTQSTTKLRLLLTILLRQPFYQESLRTVFLDFCLSGITDTRKPVAIRSLCLKLAYKQCKFFPELLSELKEVLLLLQTTPLQPGIRSACRNILRRIS